MMAMSPERAPGITRPGIQAAVDEIPVGAAQIADRADLGDRHRFEKRVDPPDPFQSRHQGGEIERGQPGIDQQIVIVKRRCGAAAALDDLGDGAVNGLPDLGSIGLCGHKVRPPSMTIVCPVMKAAAGDSRNNAAAAISSTVPSRPSGVLRRIARRWRSPSPFTMSLSK